MKGQAQFHPLKYLSALIPSILENGGKIYENTTALKIEDDMQPTILLENGHRLVCKSVIVASHFPFSDEMGLYFARMHVERSYVLAIKSEKDYPSGILPGKPDIVLKKYNTVIFVHGCFWHMHENCKDATIPKTRTEWWLKKLTSNVKRDEQVIKELIELEVHAEMINERLELLDIHQRASPLYKHVEELSSSSKKVKQQLSEDIRDYIKEVSARVVNYPVK